MPTLRTAALMLATVGLLAACNINTTPTRIEADPRLDEIISAADAALPDADADTRDADDATPDADASEDEPNADAGPTFTCTPACPANFYCLPSGLCAELATTCTQPDTLCDPARVAPTTEYICEGVFEGTAGVCRRVCTFGQPPGQNGCRNDQSCTRQYSGSDIYTCHDPCADDASCIDLDVCNTSNIVPSCRGGCRPFASGHCPDQRRCLPLDAERGYCDTAGPGGPDASCGGPSDCQEGLLCVGANGAQRCVPYCDPDATRPCDDDATCLELAQGGIGVCLPRCDVFSGPSCDEGLGCLVTGESDGACLPSGNAREGAACAATTDCRGDLQCISDGDRGACRALCRRDAEPGEPGACLEPQTCQRLTGTTVGYCE